MSEFPKTKQCIACQADIPINATICSTCSTRQNRLYGIVESVGRSVGVLSAILAFASYIISSAPSVRQALWWVDDVNVLSFSDETVVIGNNGDGEVFVSYVFIEAENGEYNSISPINKPLKVGQIFSVETIKIKDEYTLVSGVTDSEWNQYLNIAIHSKSSETADGKCIGLLFFSEHDSSYQLYSNFFGEKLRKVNGQATMYFYSNKLGVELSKQFPVYGLIYKFEKSCSDLIQ